jgi:Ca-activated chloride channel family protein
MKAQLPFAVIIALCCTSVAWAKTEGLRTPARLEAWTAKHQPLGRCPLEHTDVQADISGFVARVTVLQRFHNTFAETIEAVYVFPLPSDAAVDQMTMQVGDRTVRGLIKERNEARKTYEQAKAQGQVASLLDQERPNIFTQAVANIAPGARVDITIRYSEALTWKDGEYQFGFPTVVGPRYMPGDPIGLPRTGQEPPTTAVPDADKISPPVTPPTTRAGHDVAITVRLNAGLPIRRLESRQHAVDVEYPAADESQAVVRLQQLRTIPNKDFVLVYQTATDDIADTVLTHTDEGGKFFALVLQPPQRVRQQAIAPKELYFVIDSSGSMEGFPIETAKLAVRRCLEGLYERDTFNLMTFSGHTSYCFQEPVANTPEHRQTALAFLDDLQGSGGTEMLRAIDGCLARQNDSQRVRIVCFLTDGYVGNDLQIIDAVKRHAGTARVFAVGIGRSVNRFLLDGMARAGRGEVQYVLDERDAAGAAERFYERVRSPVLTDVKLDVGGLPVIEVYPPMLPDLFSSTPLVIKGQYRAAGRGTITLTGKTGAGPFERKIAVALPEADSKHEVLAPLWARAKVDALMLRDLAGIQSGQPNHDVRQPILDLGLRYQLLTPFTSFVAVEERRITADGQPRTIVVPVETPEGVSYEGALGWRAAAGAGGVGFGGRGIGARRAAMLGAFGGTRQSERAVAAALAWLAKQQQADGRWSFAAPPGSDNALHNPGAWQSDTAATALALLSFLGAGQTHQSKGPYQKTIAAGIEWLLKQQRPDGDLAAGTADQKLLAHALATLALSETHSLAPDRSVGRAVQAAAQFLVARQDDKTGGWAAEPGTPATLSATVWPLLALQSTHASGLIVPPGVWEKASKFLAAVQADNGAGYGETNRNDVSAATMAAGLLSRMYLDQRGGTGAILGGNKHALLLAATAPSLPEDLSRMGPSTKDAVFNLHATFFLQAQGGPQWDAWNRAQRRQLVDAQCKQGADAGSWWNPDDVRAAAGGRLFQTAVNALTLEVYYRYLPLSRRAP